METQLGSNMVILLTSWLMNPKVQCRITKDSSIILILSQINPIPRIDTYYFKILGFRKGLFPVGLSVNILKALVPSFILAT